MKTTLARPLSKTISPGQIFPAIADERGAVWLDSSLRIGGKGRQSFIARNPVAEITASCDNLDDSIEQIQRICKEKKYFAVGYISYEAGYRFLKIETDDNAPNRFPLIHFFIYESALQFEHKNETFVATNPGADDYSDILNEYWVFSDDFISESVRLNETVSKEAYLRRVKRIKEHIREGDIYQGNFTCRFDISSDFEPFDIYRRLRNLNPAPYAAYLNFGNYQIISSSPERMFRKKGDLITTCPIKGTVPSGSNNSESKFQKTKLLNSEKDRAELLMIVDLMRNDLGRIAGTGSVNVRNLFKPEAFSSVIHLVADVSAKLKENTSLKDIFTALIPGGSITGAPKKRAVEILKSYETTPRGVYTGCIGYIHGETAEFNIAIRTIIHRDDTYYVHAGGGIVADSDPESEFQEMHLKARNLFRALGVTQPVFDV